MEGQPRRLRIKQVFTSGPGESVEVRGWVATRSAIGGLIFAIIRDGTGYIQVSAKGGVTPSEAMDAIKSATKESAVVVSGVVRDDKRAPGGGRSRSRGFKVLSRAETWPITKTAAKSASFLYDVRHLSIRSRKVVATMKIRSEVVAAAFDYFRENGFTLISAPSFVQAAVEGGSTLFGVDYFGKKVYPQPERPVLRGGRAGGAREGLDLPASLQGREVEDPEAPHRVLDDRGGAGVRRPVGQHVASGRPPLLHHAAGSSRTARTS